MFEFFEFVKVREGDPLYAEIFKLRYKVYCDEWGFEKAEDHPGGIEVDQYDTSSIHFAALRLPGRELIGTIRMIMYSNKGFPIEQHFEFDEESQVALRHVDRRRCAEISRLAISKDYRRRAIDRVIFDGHDLPEQDLHQIRQERRRLENDIVLGLYREICREGVSQGVTHLYAVMARGLCALLKKVGIVFRRIGPEKDYHGMRGPYIGDMATMTRDLEQINPDLYRRFFSVD